MMEMLEHCLSTISDDSDDELLLDMYLKSRKLRKVRRRPDLLNEYDDNEFFTRFRLKKQTVLDLLVLINDDLEHNTDRNQSIPPITQLLLTLRYYATGAFVICIGDFCGLDKSTASRIIKKTSEAIARLAPRFINFPKSVAEWNRVQQGFYEKAAFPRVIGAIDCTHVKIKSPGGDNAEDYRGRDGTFSLNIQTVCSADLKIQNIVARWPGAVHDQTIFNNSSLKALFEMGYMNNLVLVGDSGYALTNYLVTPFANPQTRAQNLYNEAHARTRNVVERSYGVWKRRFPVLINTLRLKIDRLEAVIVACAVLHNLAIDRKEEEPPTDSEIARAVEETIAAERQLRNFDNIQNRTTRDNFVQYFESLL